MRTPWPAGEPENVIPDGLIDLHAAARMFDVRNLQNLDEGTRAELLVTSPSLQLILALQRGTHDLYDIGWRQFEELVAELLSAQGWTVELQRGTRDGGVDVLASRYDPQIGHLLSVWQAKKLSRERRVGISVIRELADTRDQFRASKGVIVTSSYLTQGALERVQRDSYTLGKVDRDELWEWIRHYR